MEKVVRLESRQRHAEPERPSVRRGTEEPDRTTSVFALVVAAVIVLVGFLLLKELADNSKLDDCNLAGRKNCVPIDLPVRRPGP